jgi:hypothetical protein
MILLSKEIVDSLEPTEHFLLPTECFLLPTERFLLPCLDKFHL